MLDSTSAKQSRVVSVYARVRVHDLSLLLLRSRLRGCWPPATGSSPIRSCRGTPRTSSMPSSGSWRSPSMPAFAPFWNPYHYGGHPSVADPQSLIFAPAFVLWALFDPAPSIRTFDLIVYAHLLIGGLSVGVLGWRARLAGLGLAPGRGRLHVRRTGVGPAAAHRHHPELRAVSAGAAAVADRHAAPLAAERGGLRRGGGRAGARPQSRGPAAVLRAGRRAAGRSRAPTTAALSARASRGDADHGDRRRCCCWRCRCC